MYGIEIKKARENAGFTQKEVEKATGIPQNTISWIESNKGIPNVHQCYLLAKTYNIDIEELIGRDKNSSPILDQKFNQGIINNNF